MTSKPIIYQLFPRLFTNSTATCVPNGTIKENGSGKMNDIDNNVLKKLKDLGTTHVPELLDMPPKQNTAEYPLATLTS